MVHAFNAAAYAAVVEEHTRVLAGNANGGSAKFTFSSITASDSRDLPRCYQLKGRDVVQGASVSRRRRAPAALFRQVCHDSAVLYKRTAFEWLVPLAVDRRKSSCEADREYTGCIKVGIYVEQVSAYPICVYIYI